MSIGLGNLPTDVREKSGPVYITESDFFYSCVIIS